MRFLITFWRQNGIIMFPESDVIKVHDRNGIDDYRKFHNLAILSAIQLEDEE